MSDTEKLASMIEKLLLIIFIDEQLLKYDFGKLYQFKNQTARRVLPRIRGAIKQSLQADLNNFLGKRDMKAFFEITKAYDREMPDDMQLRLSKSIKTLIPTFGKYINDRECQDDHL